MHSRMMRTACSLPYGGTGVSFKEGVSVLSYGLCQGDPPQKSMGPETDIPLEGTWDQRQILSVNLGPGSQTGSDIIQRPPWTE